ncbi:hypothetical protein [Dehalogenimonas alkenigignens]|uniref:Uncharacterized protein n=1 Tax=Dehalogenimonas alkenigignens TaxID=1217799 RepID=A0A0W0GHL0_9CHLR|nr:hypothetical protein [Dehalogenimonas alkenigignens]KTB48037.1 hypothetical protein DEALK_08820 [Dehalogenimonas alkenigignens]
MDTYKCLDCGEQVETDADEEVEATCLVCGSVNLVQVFGALANTDGPV